MVNPSSNVAGPYSEGEWATMLRLKDSINYMRKKNIKKFAIAIDKETRLLNQLKTKCAA